MRRAARVDTMQSEIVIALRHIGAEVWVIGQPCDILVGFRGQWIPIEIKSSEADSKRKTNTAVRQKEHRDRAGRVGCRMPVVWSVDMALQAIGAVK